MANVTLPANFPINTISPRLDRPAQVNRSGWTGSRTVVANPWHGKWSFSVKLAAVQDESNALPLRSFFAQLKGQVNTFYLPVTQGPQYVGTNPTAGATAAQGATSIQLTVTYTFPGANLVGDPGFDTPAHWSTSGGWSVSGSKANNSGASGYCWHAVGGIVAGNVYQYSFDITARTAGSARVELAGNTVGASGSAVGTFTGTITPTASGEYGLNSNDNFAGSVDNFVLKLGVSSGTPPLLAGMFVTVSLPSGNKQLVMLTADCTSGGVITFEPPLREAISSGAAIEAISPYAQVALADSAFGWDVQPWRLYGFSFAVDEAF